LDGDLRIAKVLEISPESITIVPLCESGAPFVDANETILKNQVLLIEFKNGAVEFFNPPTKNLVVNANGQVRKQLQGRAEEISLNNFASLNTLALCNSDISGFFEHLVTSKKAGFGMMAAYNFNQYAGIQNAFISILNNAKKNYDVGVFANLYPSHFKNRTTFYFGIFFKYTSFNFTSVVEEKIGTATNIKYVPAKGSQLATIFTIGTQTYLSKTVFLKTIVGLGAFNLRGDYKQQFNYAANLNNKPNAQTTTTTTLPKLYFGLNLGFNF
jgi:hypothetical protein